MWDLQGDSEIMTWLLQEIYAEVHGILCLSVSGLQGSICTFALTEALQNAGIGEGSAAPRL